MYYNVCHLQVKCNYGSQHSCEVELELCVYIIWWMSTQWKAQPPMMAVSVSLTKISCIYFSHLGLFMTY